MHKLEAFSQDLWKSFCENSSVQSETWLHFFTLFFSNPKLELFTGSSDKTIDDLILLGKVDNLVIFINSSDLNYKSILRECIRVLELLGSSKTRNTHILVLNTSKTGYCLFFFSPKYNELIETVKIIRFPRGKIPGYFLELIESEHEASPLELFQRLTDIPALEADFLSQELSHVQVSNTERNESFIGYLTLLLILSGLTDSNNFFDWLRNKSSNSKELTLSAYITKLEEYITDHNMNTNDLMKIGTIFHNMGLEHLPINRILVKELLERYSFSLNEPSNFIQEVSITPLVFSKMVEELLIPKSKKKKKGKYYTSSSNTDFIAHLAVYRMLSNKLTGINTYDLYNLVFMDWGFQMEPYTRLLNQLTIFPPFLRILDPACGSGTFLVSVVRLLYNLVASGLTFENIDFPKVKIFGIDSDRMAVLVTQLRLILFKMHIISNTSMLNKAEKTIPPISLEFDSVIEGDFFFHEKIYNQKFDLIIGNPPWVRHEDIGVDHPLEYKRALQTRIDELPYGDTFFDRKSDFYIYFTLMSLFLLENGGILAFLTSNAWLEVKYGQTLQKFLLDPDKKIGNFEIIYRSGKRLWNQLGINSIILIAEKSPIEKAKLLGGTFTEAQVDFSEIPFSSLEKGIIKRKMYEDQYYRTETITLELLNQTHKWAGMFLRTSGSERKLLRRIGKKGIPLSSLTEVRFGIKTGANDFFHLQRVTEKQRLDGKVYIENRVGYKGLIEQKYLVPLIKSPAHIKGFVIHSSNISSLWLFYCLDSPAQLQGSEAWKYIKWAETTPVTIKQGKESGINTQGFSSIRSVKQREFWYSLGKYPTSSLLWTKSYHNKPGCFYNQAQAMPDQRFYAIILKQNEYLPLIFTYLNSSLVWAQMEAKGNTNMGYGVLDTNVYWLKSLKIPIEAMTEKNQIVNLMKRLMQEKDRVSMLQFSQIRTDIDLFYTKYFNLSDNSISCLYDFISRSIHNRIRKKLPKN